LLQNLYQAIEGCLSIDMTSAKGEGKERVLEIVI
jgi:hypothetical protein